MRNYDIASETVALLLKMGNIIDEKHFADTNAIDIGVSSREIGCGCLALSSRFREGAIRIIELQMEIYKLRDRIECLKLDLKDSLDIGELTDKQQEEIREHYERLLKEDEAKNGE